MLEMQAASKNQEAYWHRGKRPEYFQNLYCIFGLQKNQEEP